MKIITIAQTDNERRIKSEQVVLQGCIEDNDNISLVSQFLTEKEFTDWNKKIWLGLKKMYDEEGKLDLILLGDSFDFDKAVYLASLQTEASLMPKKIILLKHIELILNHEQRKNIYKAFREGKKDVLKTKDIEGLISYYTGLLTDISEIKKTERKEKIQEIAEDVEDILKADEQGLKTSFSFLDRKTHGIKEGDFWVLAGFNGTGKTWFSLKMLIETQGAFISTEMTREQIFLRLLSLHTRVNTYYLNENKEEVNRAIDELSQRDIRIIDGINSLREIKNKIRYLAREGVSVFYIDYLQNLVVQKANSEYEAMTQTARDLKNLCLRERIAIIALSQISYSEQSKGLASRQTAFKGSGHIGASCDVGIQLRREKEREMTSDEKKVEMQVKIVKNRFGSEGFKKLIFDQNYGGIYEVSNLRTEEEGIDVFGL